MKLAKMRLTSNLIIHLALRAKSIRSYLLTLLLGMLLIDLAFCYYDDLPASSNSGAVSHRIEPHRLLPRCITLYIS